MQKISTQTDTSASDTDAANAVEGERIAKYLARAGVASRREVERMIAQGIITVDGTVLSTPAFKVTPAMDIRVDGTRVGKPDRARVWRYHKPDNLVTTHADPQGRRTVFQALEGQVPRVISVGRLDLTTEGLLLLTNDGGLARTLELPSTGWTRRYRVRAWGRVKQDQLDALKDGITIEGIQYGPIRAQVDSQQGDNVWVTLSIKEGKNREVRTIMRALDLQVNRLIRTAYGPFQLGKLARGAVEEVTPKQLKDQLGKKLCTQIGLE
ncbi:MAG: pseudouridine synthase [Pseudomonadota bacterium]